VTTARREWSNDLRIRGGALEIKNGLTHYPQQRETYLFFRGDADLPERMILLSLGCL
jgi:hypothetical protein